MKKITLLIFLLTATLGFSQADVTVDPNANWVGFVNAFNAADDAGPLFGFGYPVDVMKTTITPTTVTLQPNFAIWPNESGNADWFDNPGNPPSNPNKKIEGTSFIEDASLVGQAVDFTGTVETVTIDGSYDVFAFIKVLDGNNGFATVIDQRTPLTAAGDFMVSVDAATTGAGTLVQYGFIVYGLIADPATEGALGSVVVTSEGSGGGCVPGSDGTELVANGGFETGDFTDWELFPSGAGQQTVTMDNPSSGSFSANLNNTVAPSASLIKSANRGIGDICPGATVTVSFDLRGEGPAGGVFFAELFSEIDGGGTSASEILGGGPIFPDADINVWTSFEFTTTVGPDVSAGVSLQFNAATGGAPGSTANFFIDNVSMVIGNPLSIDEFSNNFNVKVYPNPTLTTWTISSPNNQNLTSVLIYDLLGKEVVSMQPNSSEVSLDATELRSGIYLAKLSTANGTKTVKLVKN